MGERPSYWIIKMSHVTYTPLSEIPPEPITLSQFSGHILRRLHLRTDHVTAAQIDCPSSNSPSNTADKWVLAQPVPGFIVSLFFKVLMGLASEEIVQCLSIKLQLYQVASVTVHMLKNIQTWCLCPIAALLLGKHNKAGRAVEINYGKPLYTRLSNFDLALAVYQIHEGDGPWIRIQLKFGLPQTERRLLEGSDHKSDIMCC